MWEQIEENKSKSAMLIFYMAVFLLGLGYVIGMLIDPKLGIYGMEGAFIVWFIMTWTSYYKGDSILLSVSRARKIGPDDHKQLYNVVEEMKIASGLTKIPDIYIIDDDAPNAFATGRNPETAKVAVTSGLLKMLSRDELQAVIAHEIAHINNRDVLYMTIAGIMMGTIVLIADFGSRCLYGGTRSRSSNNNGSGQLQLIILLVAVVCIIIAPIVARIFYYAISRKREYLADACSAQYTRYPVALASALEKVCNAGLKLNSANKVTAPMYIVNPFDAQHRALDAKFGELFSTHPSTLSRIRILKQMTNAGFDNYNEIYCKVTGDTDNIIGASSLVGSNNNITIREIPPAKPEHVEKKAHTASVRTTTDLLWNLNNYIFIKCSCGTKLKIPPVYANEKIICPHCKREHIAGKQESKSEAPANNEQSDIPLKEKYPLAILKEFDSKLQVLCPECKTIFGADLMTDNTIKIKGYEDVDEEKEGMQIKCENCGITFSVPPIDSLSDIKQ